MADRFARIVIFGGILMFGLRGLMTEYSLAVVALICVLISATADFFYTSCFLSKECRIGEIVKRPAEPVNNFETLTVDI